MKYSRLIALLLVIAIAFSLVGCKNDEDDYVHKDGEGGEEDGGEGDMGNGVTYVYTSTKLHRSNCYYAAGMDELFKKSYSGDLSVLVERDFPSVDCAAMRREKFTAPQQITKTA